MSTTSTLAKLTIIQMWLKNQAQASAAKTHLLANSSLGISFILAGDEVQHAVSTPRL